MNLFKKVLMVVLALTIGAAVFAQSKDAYLFNITDADCKNFAKNFDAINSVLEEYNVDTSNNYTAIEQQSDYVKLNNALGKYGISGENKIGKILTMSMGATAIALDEEFNSNPMTKSLMGGTSPAESIKESIHTDDYAVIKKNYKTIYKAINKEDAPEETASSASDSTTSNKSKKGTWTDDDTEELKNAAKEEVKNAAKDAVKNNLKKGLKNLF